MDTEPTGFFADPHTWVLFSAIVFAIVAWKAGKKPVLDTLDGRTARIKADLEEAARLKAEAERLLADYKQKQHEAVATAEKIVGNARESIALMHKQAEEKLAESMKRREDSLLDRISRAEAAAVQELRSQAADIAAAAAKKLLADSMSKQGSKLIDAAIEELPRRMN